MVKHEEQTRSASESVAAPAKLPGLLVEANDQIIKEAVAARDLITAASLSSVIGSQTVGATAARLYLSSFLRDAGNPSDPVERLLLEQFVLAHHRLARLHVQAADAKDPEHMRIINAVSIRLLGELRRLGLAIRQYRLPPSGKSFSVIHQQNVAAEGGNQKVSYADQSTKATLACRDELNGTAGESHADDEPAQEPVAGGRWAAERLQEAAVDA